MLTGKPPFEADTSVALIHKHLKEAPKPPSKLNPQVTSALEKIILKCMEKKPERRYQRAYEITKVIDEAKPEFIPAAKPSKLRWKLYVPIAAIILIGIAIGFYYFIIKEKPPAPPAQTGWRNSIAVLPFADLSENKDQEYFCDGMTEELINALTHIKDLRVIARTSSFVFKGKHEDIREIGRKLDVETLLEGSVRKSGNRLRITAQLVNVADGSHLWSERYYREMADVFAIQDEISQAIVNALRIKLGVEEKNLLVKRYTENLEAYNSYLLGLHYWNRFTEEDINKAIKYFEEAIRRDPNYALAYAGLADCYHVFGLGHGSGTHIPMEMHQKAQHAVTKPLEIEDDLAEAHTVLGVLTFAFEFDWERGEKEFKEAIQLKPSLARAETRYGLLLLCLGRNDEAIEANKRALELDPLSPILYTNAALNYIWAQQYDKAIPLLFKALELDPNFKPAHDFISKVYKKKGMFAEAIEELQISSAISDSIWSISFLGNIYALAGKHDEAQRILQELLERKKQTYVSAWEIARVYIGIGEKDRAIEWLEKAYEERAHWIAMLNVDADFDVLRPEPRFKALLKKMNLE